MKDLNTIVIRPDDPDNHAQVITLPSVDEIVIGDWFHMERMSGTNVRCWSIILTDQDGQPLNITVTEKNGKINNAFVYENCWEAPENNSNNYDRYISE